MLSKRIGYGRINIGRVVDMIVIFIEVKVIVMWLGVEEWGYRKWCYVWSFNFIGWVRVSGLLYIIYIMFIVKVVLYIGM